LILINWQLTYIASSSILQKELSTLMPKTNIQGQRMLRHVSTRWITLQDVLIRIMEQFDNLCEYFLTFLPTQKGFKEKAGIAHLKGTFKSKQHLVTSSFQQLAILLFSLLIISKSL